MPYIPRHLALASSGQLAGRARAAVDRLSRCDLCPRRCLVDRAAGQTGRCRTERLAGVAGVGAHFGEERPLVGRGGSGTIFFSACNLACLFCQNYEISSEDEGRTVQAAVLAAMMLRLQSAGCENINLVSPSHVVPQLLEALVLAVDGGLRLPLVYNTGGYDSLETLRLLEGVVDIYMPDMKYSSDEVGLRLSGVADYATRNREAVREMHRQVGDLVLGPDGVAERGLLVRHLVLPCGLAGTEKTVTFLAEEISRETYLNVMDEYRPCYRAGEVLELGRRVTREECAEAARLAGQAGLSRLCRC